MSPRSNSANQKIRDDRQEQILHAALKVFATKGLNAAKISDIAAAAKISQGLVHHYFGSKEGIYTAVAERAMSGALQAVTDTPAPDDAPYERLVSICERMLQGLKIHPEYLLIVIQCLLSEDVPPKARELVSMYSHSIFSNLVELIKAGQVAKQIVAEDPQELTMTFLATIQGLVLAQFTRQAFWGDAALPEEGFLPKVETVLRILKAGETE
jgi:AcrR family transcriptional regulator